MAGALVLFDGTDAAVQSLDSEVTKAVIMMVIIGACTFVAAFIHTWAWTISGENQARRYFLSTKN